MSQRKALFKRYPAMRYKPNVAPQRVENKKDDEALLADGWFKTPTQAVLELTKDMHNEDPASVQMLVKMTDKIAAIVNMMERLDTCKSKKDLYWLAEQLAIPVEANLGLKPLRAKIREGAKDMTELNDAIEAAKNADSDSENTATH